MELNNNLTYKIIANSAKITNFAAKLKLYIWTSSETYWHLAVRFT